MRLESDTDPGAELVAVLKQQFPQARTRTVEEWLIEDQRKTPASVARPASENPEAEHTARRRAGKDSGRL